MRRSLSERRNSKLAKLQGLNIQELNQMTVTQLRGQMKKVDPNYKVAPMKGWNKLSQQQKAQITKIRKDALVYAIDQKVNKPQSKEASSGQSSYLIRVKGIPQIAVSQMESVTSSGAKKSTRYYTPGIKRSDLSYEELMQFLQRLQRLSTGVNKYLLVGLRNENGQQQLIRIEELIKKEIYYAESINVISLDYTIFKHVVFHVVPQVAACKSEDYVETMMVDYGDQQKYILKAKSYKSSNSNCFIVIFKRFSKSSITCDKVRKQIKIGAKDAIPISMLPQIADIYNCGYVIYINKETSLEVQESYETQRELFVEILIQKGHALHLVNIPNDLRLHALSGVNLQQKNIVGLQQLGWKTVLTDPSVQEVQSLVDTQQHFMIHAAGGCGKTFVSKQLKNVLFTATTGTAAKILSGYTIDSILTKYGSCKNNKRFVNDFGNKSHILIDECSMISSVKLIQIWEFCTILQVKLILVGDVCQLPPVKAEYFFMSINWRELVQPNLTLVNLTVIKRQNNVEQQVFLNNMRINNFDFGFFKKLRQQPMIEDPQVILCSTNEIRKKYNDTEYAKLSTEEKTYDMVKNIKLGNVIINEQYKEQNKQLIIKKVKSEADVNELQQSFKVNCKVMITHNINVVDGITNGTFCTVKELKEQSIVVQLEGNRTYEVNYIQKEVEFQSQTLSFAELPLTVAYAITIHKAQGQTVQSALIDITGLFEKGQLYVALTRVSDLNNICIKGFGKQETIETYAQTNYKALAFTNGEEIYCEEEQHLIDYSLKQLQGIKRKTITPFKNNNLIYFDFETRNSMHHNFMKQTPYYNYLHHFKDGQSIHRESLFDQLWEGGERCDVAGKTYEYVKKQMTDYADLMISLDDQKKQSDHTAKMRNKVKHSIPTIIAYNGSGFDLHFIVQKLLNDVSIKKRFTINTIYKGTQLVCFLINEKKTGKVVLKSHDLCQVLNMPLEKALKEFCKGDDKVKALAEKIAFKEEIIMILNEYTNNPNMLKPGVMTPIYKYITTEDGIIKEPVYDKDGVTQKCLDLNKELIQYANNDTEVLHPLYEKINELTEKYFGASIFSFLTAGSMAWYGLLINLPAECLAEGKTHDQHGNLNKIINTKLYKPEIQEYDFIKQSMYGGRVAPRVHQIIQEKVEEESREQERDCRAVYLDISGMYASIMKNEVLPYGKSYWFHKEALQAINDKVKTFKRQNSWRDIYNVLLRENGQFIAEVDFCENPWNPEPVVPYKEDRTYFINDRRTQVITSLDLALIIQSGGTVYNISRVLAWENYGNIMEKWIAKTLEIKEEGNRSGDSGKKAFGKLLANSTYGQTLKGDKREKLEYIDNIDSAMQFCEKYELTNFVEYDNFDAYIGKSKVNKFEFVSSRCQQIGVFVLAYTRGMIFDICEIAMPNRYNEKGIYEQPYNGDTDSLVFRKWQADLLVQAGWIGLENGKLTDELGEESVWFNPPTAKKIIETEKETGKDFRYGLVNEDIYKNSTLEEKRNPANYHFTFITNAIFSAPKSYAVQYHNNVKNKVAQKMRFKGISEKSTIKVFNEETGKIEYNNYSFDLIKQAYALRNESDDKKLVACLPNKPQVIKRPSKQEGAQNMFVITNANERRHVDKKDQESAFKCVSRILFKTQWIGRYHYNENLTIPYGHPLGITFEQFKVQQKATLQK